MLTTASRPFVIPEPRLGILELEDHTALVAGDTEAFAPLFTSLVRSTKHVPECDVLLVYAKIGDGGAITGSIHSLQKIVALSGAPIAIVATDNSADSYIAATRGWLDPPPSPPSTNLVMTIGRRDPLFAQFFTALFTQMKQGVTMPQAWATLAPQVPDARQDLPATLFLIAAGHVAFAHRPSLLQRWFGR